EPGLMNPDQFAFQGARAYGGIRAGGLQSRKQFVYLFDRGGKVGVGKKYELAPRLQNSVPDREAFAMVAVVSNQADAGKLRDYLDRRVGRAVIYDYQFHRVRL